MKRRKKLLALLLTLILAVGLLTVTASAGAGYDWSGSASGTGWSASWSATNQETTEPSWFDYCDESHQSAGDFVSAHSSLVDDYGTVITINGDSGASDKAHYISTNTGAVHYSMSGGTLVINNTSTSYVQGTTNGTGVLEVQNSSATVYVSGTFASIKTVGNAKVIMDGNLTISGSSSGSATVDDKNNYNYCYDLTLSNANQTVTMYDNDATMDLKKATVTAGTLDLNGAEVSSDANGTTEYALKVTGGTVKSSVGGSISSAYGDGIIQEGGTIELTGYTVKSNGTAKNCGSVYHHALHVKGTVSATAKFTDCKFEICDRSATDVADTVVLLENTNTSTAVDFVNGSITGNNKSYSVSDTTYYFRPKALTVSAGKVTVDGTVISGFGSAAVDVSGTGDVTITGNATVTNSAETGVAVAASGSTAKLTVAAKTGESSTTAPTITGVTGIKATTGATVDVKGAAGAYVTINATDAGIVGEGAKLSVDYAKISAPSGEGNYLPLGIKVTSSTGLGAASGGHNYVKVTNSVITVNSAEDEAVYGVYAKDSDLEVEHSEISAENTADTLGENTKTCGVYFENSGKAKDLHVGTAATSDVVADGVKITVESTNGQAAGIYVNGGNQIKVNGAYAGTDGYMDGIKVTSTNKSATGIVLENIGSTSNITNEKIVVAGCNNTYGVKAIDCKYSGGQNDGEIINVNLNGKTLVDVTLNEANGTVYGVYGKDSGVGLGDEATVSVKNGNAYTGSHYFGVYMEDTDGTDKAKTEAKLYGKVNVVSTAANMEVVGVKTTIGAKCTFVQGDISVTGDGTNKTVGIENAGTTDFTGGTITLVTANSTGVVNTGTFTMGTLGQPALGNTLGGREYPLINALLDGASRVHGVENTGIAKFYAGAIKVTGGDAVAISAKGGTTSVLTNKAVRKPIDTLTNYVFFAEANRTTGVAFHAQDGAKWEIRGTGALFVGDKALNVWDNTQKLDDTDSFVSGGTFVGIMQVLDNTGNALSTTTVEDLLATNHYVRKNAETYSGTSSAAWLNPTEGYTADSFVTAYDVTTKHNKLNDAANVLTVVDAEWELRYALEYDEGADDLVDNYVMPCSIILDANSASADDGKFHGAMPKNGDVDVDKEAFARNEGAIVFEISETAQTEYNEKVTAYNAYQTALDTFTNVTYYQWLLARAEWYNTNHNLDGFETAHPEPVFDDDSYTQKVMPEPLSPDAAVRGEAHVLDVNGKTLSGSSTTAGHIDVLHVSGTGDLLTYTSVAGGKVQYTGNEGQAAKVEGEGLLTNGEAAPATNGAALIGRGYSSVLLGETGKYVQNSGFVGAETKDGSPATNRGILLQNGNGPAVVVNDGYVAGDNSAIDNDSVGTVTVNNGSIKGGTNGILQEKAGTTNVYGGTITGTTGDGIKATAGTLTVVPAAAVAPATEGTPVTITGGTNGIATTNGALIKVDSTNAVLKVTGTTGDGIYVNKTKADIKLTANAEVKGYKNGAYVSGNQLTYQNKVLVSGAEIIGTTFDGVYVSYHTGLTVEGASKITGGVNGVKTEGYSAEADTMVTGGEIIGGTYGINVVNANQTLAGKLTVAPAGEIPADGDSPLIPATPVTITGGTSGIVTTNTGGKNVVAVILDSTGAALTVTGGKDTTDPADGVLDSGENGISATANTITMTLTKNANITGHTNGVYAEDSDWTTTKDSTITVDGATIAGGTLNGLWAVKINTVTVSDAVADHTTITGATGIHLGGNSNATVNSGKIVSTGDNGVGVDVDTDAKLTVKGGTITAAGANGKGINSSGDATVTGGTITGAYGIYATGTTSKLTVKPATGTPVTITGTAYGIETDVMSGIESVEIDSTGAKLEVTATGKDTTPEPDGTLDVGDGINVKAKTITMTLTDNAKIVGAINGIVASDTDGGTDSTITMTGGMVVGAQKYDWAEDYDTGIVSVMGVATTGNDGSKDGINVGANVTLNISGGSVAGFEDGVDVAATGTANVSGGTIIGGTNGVNVASGAAATVNGGKVNGATGILTAGTTTITAVADNPETTEVNEASSPVINGTTDGVNVTAGTTTISGGTVKGTNALNVTGGTVNVSGGTADGKNSITAGTVNVSGGTLQNGMTSISGTSTVVNVTGGTFKDDVTLSGGALNISGDSNSFTAGESITVSGGKLTVTDDTSDGKEATHTTVNHTIYQTADDADAISLGVGTQYKSLSMAKVGLKLADMLHTNVTNIKDTANSNVYEVNGAVLQKQAAENTPSTLNATTGNYFLLTQSEHVTTAGGATGVTLTATGIPAQDALSGTAVTASTANTSVTLDRVALRNTTSGFSFKLTPAADDTITTHNREIEWTVKQGDVDVTTGLTLGITPITVIDGEGLEKSVLRSYEGTDITVTVDKTLAAGTYIITAKSVGDTDKTDTFTVTVAKTSLSDATVTLTQNGNYVYTDSEITAQVASVKVTVNGTEYTLVAGADKDYTVSGNTGTNVNDYTLTVTAVEGKDCSDNKTATWKIIAGDLATSTLTLTPSSFTADGSAKIPTVKVVYNNVELNKDTDYTVSGTTTATAAGTYTVTITGAGNYAGTKDATWKINSAGGGGGGGAVAPKTYTITCGTGVKADVKSSAAGKTITLTVSEGYENIVVKDADGKAVTVSGNTFKMPEADVTVSVSKKAVTATTYDKCDKGETCVLTTYTDVENSGWYHDGIHYCLDNGMMNGVGNGMFAPNDSTTRAMIWTILGRLDGETITGATWADDAQAWSVKAGISDGTNPNGNVTREQLAAMLYRFAALKGYDVTASGDLATYGDAASVSDYAVEAMQWAVGAGIINGDNGNLKPTAGASRAEVATMLMRFCETIVK